MESARSPHPTYIIVLYEFAKHSSRDAGVRGLAGATDGASAHLLRGAFSLVGVEVFFAEAQGFWGGFDVFVGGDVFERALKAHLQGRGEADAFAVALAAHVGELFGAAGIAPMSSFESGKLHVQLSPDDLRTIGGKIRIKRHGRAAVSTESAVRSSVS